MSVVFSETVSFASEKITISVIKRIGLWESCWTVPCTALVYSLLVSDNLPLSMYFLSRELFTVSFRSWPHSTFDSRYLPLPT